jgi:hypothetical protein
VNVAIPTLAADLGASIPFQAVSRAETPRATSAINVIQRLGGAIGTALFAIVLPRQAGAGADGVGGAGGVGALAGAFGTTF